MEQSSRSDASPTPLTLAIVRDGSASSMILTDSASLCRAARLDVDAAAIDRMSARRPSGIGGGVPDPQVGGLAAYREAGGRLFATLFSPSIRDAIVSSGSRPLILQLGEEFIDIPWETVFDGTHFLAEKFAVSRRIASREPSTVVPADRRSRHFLRLLIVAQPEEPGQPGGGFGLADGWKNGWKNATAPAVDVVYHDDFGQAASRDKLRLADIVHFTHSRRLFDRHGQAVVDVERMVEGESGGPSLFVFDRAWEIEPAQARQLLRLGWGPNRAALFSSASVATPDAEWLSFYRELRVRTVVSEAVRRVHAQRGRTPWMRLYGDQAFSFTQSAPPSNHDDNVRQVTVMSHDLVGSTQLLERCGAERYSEVLRRYHECCSEVVRRHGGMSDDPQGDDGIMCYFGVPQALEDAASRCLRAAFEIIESVASLGLSVRIGIATGRVAVAAGTPVGVVIHLAARLQGMTEPGTVLIADSTRRLVGGAFRYEPVPMSEGVKGIDNVEPVYRTSVKTRGGEMELASPRTPFVGRDSELAVLHDHWSATIKGGGRTVLVCGEAGIGKSRLIREFRQSLKATRHHVIECRCAREHATSAFHALIDALRRLMQIEPVELAEAMLAKIRISVPQIPDLDDAVQLIAELISVSPVSDRNRNDHSAEKQRQQTLKVLLAWLEQVARTSPVCLLVEDVQWIDPSTRELLNRLVTDAPSAPVLVLITLRDEERAAWIPELQLTEVRLGGLSVSCSRALVLGASAGADLPVEVVNLLVDKGDGVPLFLEESTRMAVDFRLDTRTPLSRDFLPSVPATIHDLLMVRLDRLGPAKRIAQLGATLGREFTSTLLAAVLADGSPALGGDLATGLTALVDSGLLLAASLGDETTYIFKHALVRDAAYQSLWERDKKKIHLVIAKVLVDKFPMHAKTQPEIVAAHYQEGGSHMEASTHWEKAALHATSRSAHHEAISHVSCALASLQHIAQGEQRDRVELRLQLLLAGRLIATDGYGATRVASVYDRAAELCRAVGDRMAMMKVQLGLEGYHFMRGDFDRAHALAIDAVAMASNFRSPMHQVQSSWALANLLFHQGDVRTAVERMDACFHDYQQLEHRPSGVQDPGIMCLCYSAWGMWELGFPDQSLERVQRVVALAEALDHKFSMGEAYGFATTVHYFRGDHVSSLACAERAVEICEEGGFAVWLAHARMMRGRLLAQTEPQRGIEEMRRGFDMWASTGAVVTRPFYLALRAEGHALAGEFGEALKLLGDALQVVVSFGERYYEAEIRRLLGELTLRSARRDGVDRTDEAERWLTGAHACAESQSLNSIALRAATSLARLWSEKGRIAEARSVLCKAYDRFDEGLQTYDLVDARSVAERIGGRSPGASEPSTGRRLRGLR